MHTIGQLLQSKGTEVATIDQDATVYEALARMANKEIGSLVVLKRDKPVGLITERDYARNIVLKNRTSKQTKLREIISHHVPVVHPEQSIGDGMAIMTEKRVRHLPVMREEALVGIISIGDLVKAIIDDQQFVIEQLVSYINS